MWHYITYNKEKHLTVAAGTKYSISLFVTNQQFLTTKQQYNKQIKPKKTIGKKKQNQS